MKTMRFYILNSVYMAEYITEGKIFNSAVCSQGGHYYVSTGSMMERNLVRYDFTAAQTAAFKKFKRRKEKMAAKYFKPEAGTIYLNKSGETFLCLSTWEGPKIGREMTAEFERQPDGWRLIAHGVAQFADGTIEWDYSTEGHWPGGWPKKENDKNDQQR